MIRTILALSLSGLLFACGGVDDGAQPDPAEQNDISEPGEQSEDAMMIFGCITRWCSHPPGVPYGSCQSTQDSGHTFVRIICF